MTKLLRVLPSFLIQNEEGEDHLNLLLYRTDLLVNNYMLTHDEKFKSEATAVWVVIDNLLATLDDAFKKSNMTIMTKDWASLKILINNFVDAQHKIINTVNAQELITLQKESVVTFNKILDIIDGPLTATSERVGGMFDLQYKQVENGNAAIVNNMVTIRWIEYVVLVISIISSLIIAMYTSRGVINQINIFRFHSNKIATGDLTQRIMISSHDEMGQLVNDLNTMTDSLSSITKQITQSCHNMVGTLEEVKRAVDTQSSGASEQASSINQITASLEEIEKSSAQTMEKAKALGGAAERTSETSQ